MGDQEGREYLFEGGLWRITTGSIWAGETMVTGGGECARPWRRGCKRWRATVCWRIQASGPIKAGRRVEQACGRLHGPAGRTHSATHIPALSTLGWQRPQSP